MDLPITQSQITDITDKDINSKIVHILLREVEQLRKEVSKIKNEKIINELKLPEEIINQSGILESSPKVLKRGRGARPILESEIKEAQEKYDTAFACARYLGVHHKTYKKWAKRYNLYKTNPWGKGSKKRYYDPNKGKYPLNRVLNGEFPNYPIYRLKDLLIRSGIKKAECENCGFKERRITDDKIPLILNFEDGNEKNHLLDNIKVFCYNCTFLCGKGYLKKGKVKMIFNDPDRAQGATKKIDARF